MVDAGRPGRKITEQLPLADALERHVADGMTVALEGFTHLIPFAAGHELIRQERRDLTLVRMTPDLIYDQLIGMGCASRRISAYGGDPGRLPPGLLAPLLAADGRTARHRDGKDMGYSADDRTGRCTASRCQRSRLRRSAPRLRRHGRLLGAPAAGAGAYEQLVTPRPTRTRSSCCT